MASVWVVEVQHGNVWEPVESFVIYGQALLREANIPTRALSRITEYRRVEASDGELVGG